MKKRAILLVIMALVATVTSIPSSASAQEISAQSIPSNIKLDPVITGLTTPLLVTNAGDGSNRLFVVQQGGKILIFKNGSLNTSPFIDMGTNITYGGERGLLGLAFAPDYETSGNFYVYYNNLAGDVEIARYTVSSGDPDLADDTTREILITIPKPFTNHNGGMLAFGPDGYLYAAIGDGGSHDDPDGNGQNLNVLLAKILRLDVSGDNFPLDPAKNYAIPPSNPFVGTGNSEEIWAYGLRNPWRFSFDRSTGDLYIGDVGQGAREEIDFQPATSAGGENYGWDEMEGTLCHEPLNGCDQTNKVLPVAEYNHSIGCSITGGYVYRGTLFPSLQGIYLYSDYCGGQLFALKNNGGGAWESALLLDTPYNITTFGEGEDGELYLNNYSTGTIYHIAEDVAFPANGEHMLTLRPTFDWMDVPGALGYSIQISRVNNFKTLLLNGNSALSTFTSPRDLPANTTLYWRYRSRSPVGAWSAAFSFVTPSPPSIPVLKSPQRRKLITSQNPLLVWSVSTIPSGTFFFNYQVQVDDDAAFASPEVDDTSITDNLTSQLISPFSLNPDKIYYWRVRATNTLGESSSWSKLRSLRTTILPPVLNLPADANALNYLRPSFDWDDVLNAAGYTIQIVDSSGHALTKVVTLSSYTPSADLKANTTYSWHVKSRPKPGHFGPSGYSMSFSFTTGNPPGIPVLRSPFNAASVFGTTPVFDWNNIPSPPIGVTFDHYQIQIATDPMFSNIVDDQSTLTGDITASSYTPAASTLNLGIKYFWRVRSWSPSDFSSWSGIRSVLLK